MASTKKIFKIILTTCLSVLGIALVATLVLHWSGADIGLAGSGLMPVIEFLDEESRIREIELDRQSNAYIPEETTREVEPLPAEAAKPASVEDEQPVIGENYWTQYRGPNRAGLYEEGPVNTNWPAEGLEESWRQKIGGGYASMIVADSRIITIEQRRNLEVVAAYNLDDGRQIWEHSWKTRFSEPMGGDGPRATPTWDAGKIYALGANGDLYCLNAENGKDLWNRNILKDAGASNVTWGMAGSPLIVDGLVITQPGGRDGKSVIAYDKQSGEIHWTALNDVQGYVAPQVVTLAGQRQLLMISGVRIMGASLEDGSLLWEHEWRTSYDANSAQPLVVDEQHVFVSSGYGHGATLLKINAADDGFSVEEVWFNLNMKNKFNPSVLVDDVVYGLDEGILVALDVWTGERHWKGGRYRYGQLLYASGHLIIVSEDGDLALVKATADSHQELVRFSSIPGKTWNVPAIADGRLLVRNQTEMVAYDLR